MRLALTRFIPIEPRRTGATLGAGRVVLPALQAAPPSLQKDGHLDGAAHSRPTLQALQRGRVEFLD